VRLTGWEGGSGAGGVQRVLPRVIPLAGNRASWGAIKSQTMSSSIGMAMQQKL
jgi:hypothetical protein